MSVLGLPTAVEKTLTALLTENSVSSWKIVGNGSSTVFVLRLEPTGEMSTNMDDPVLNRRTQVQYYRRKPPSQIKRDIQRVKQQQQQQQQQQQRHQREQVSAHGSNTPDVNELPVFDTLHNTQEVVDQHMTPAHIDLSDTDSECIGAEGGIQADLQSEVNLQPPDVHTEPPIDSVIAGFDAGVINNYVASLTERSVQNRLRNNERNKAFRKVVYHRSEDADVLLCESDDLVLEYSCAVQSEAECTYWYVKQNESRMLAEECARQAILRKGKRVSNTKFAETESRALQQLHALHALIGFYLGT